MNLDGNGHAQIVTNISWPRGIAVDYKENRICWGDAGEWSELRLPFDLLHSTCSVIPSNVKVG